MADMSSNLDLVQTAQAQKEVTLNALADAGSPSTLYGRRQSTSAGLTWGYYGGNIVGANGSIIRVENGTITLPNGTANVYIEADASTGVLSWNTAGWTPGRIRAYRATTSGGLVTGYVDSRTYLGNNVHKLLTKAASGSNITLNDEEARCEILEITGTLTADVAVNLPAAPRIFAVANKTDGSFSLTFKTAAGSGVVVASGMRAMVYADGTNIVRLTADV